MTLDAHFWSLLLLQSTLWGLSFYGVHKLTEHSLRFTWALIVILPILFFPLYMNNHFSGWFNIAKTITMIILIVVVCFARQFNNKKIISFMSVFLPVNILEAVISDFHNFNPINGIAGIIACLVLPTPNHCTLTDKKVISYPMTLSMVLSYIIWHATFAYGYPTISGFKSDYLVITLVLHLISIIAYYENRKIWLQARMHTITFFFFMLEASVVKFRHLWPLTEDVFYNNKVHFLLQVTALIFTSSVAMHQLYRYCKNNESVSYITFVVDKIRIIAARLNR